MTISKSKIKYKSFFSVKFLVLQLKDVVENKQSSTIPIRSINIPGEPYVLAISCDHTMLSVCYTAHGLSFIDIYAVQTFLSNVSFIPS